MTPLFDAAELRALTDETQRIWESKAAFWDEQMGEGNAFSARARRPCQRTSPPDPAR
jgi:hypothetical protein